MKKVLLNLPKSLYDVFKWSKTILKTDVERNSESVKSAIIIAATLKRLRRSITYIHSILKLMYVGCFNTTVIVWKLLKWLIKAIGRYFETAEYMKFKLTLSCIVYIDDLSPLPLVYHQSNKFVQIFKTLGFIILSF